MTIKLREAIERYNKRRPKGAPAMTQARLATAVGTTQALVSRHMNGRIVPSLRLLSAYAGALEVPVGDLIAEGEE
jgi:transcriptional regulator with XRE-family HTH domain